MRIWQCAILLMRTWEGEAVVFHRESGDTHLVDALTARLLACLQEEPLEEQELARCLGIDAGAEFSDMLEHLAASGLISCQSI